MRKIFVFTVLMMLSAFMTAQNTKKVAVMEVNADKSVSKMHAVMIRGGLETVVGNTPGYEVYDRSNFEAIMQEQNFQRSGAVKDSDIKRLGELAGVQYIIVPEASAGDGQIYILVKMLDVETGKFGGVKEKLCKANAADIKQACEEIGEDLFLNNVSIIKSAAGSNGIYSVTPDKKVMFSKGNLQYQPSTRTWRFAEKQWDIIGKDNSQIGKQDYDGWIDLFGWGTGDAPTKINVNDRGNYNVFDDWGNNNISNGDNKDWYCMTINEWIYVITMRSTNSGIRYAKAIVNEVCGMILLPDDWSKDKYELNYTNNPTCSFDSNVITQSVWENELEANGAVFLPAAGTRSGYNTFSYKIYSKYDVCEGVYWSKTIPKNDTYKEHAYYVEFMYNGANGKNSLNVQAWGGRHYGMSVRLVTTIK